MYFSTIRICVCMIVVSIVFSSQVTIRKAYAQNKDKAQKLQALYKILPPKAAKIARQLMTSSQNKKSGFIKTYHEIPPIRQHAEFCQRNPQECRLANGNGRMKLTKIRWRQLVSINKWVNKNIIYTPEKGDVWGYPKRVYYYHRGKFRFKYKGDCEEYVILKRHKLIKKGWPASSLLITVVWDENGEGHAVLTARTAQGDYVLDNKSSKVKKWNKVPYKFRKMQSHRNPRQWVSLRPRLKVGM